MRPTLFQDNIGPALDKALNNDDYSPGTCHRICKEFLVYLQSLKSPGSIQGRIYEALDRFVSTKDQNSFIELAVYLAGDPVNLSQQFVNLPSKKRDQAGIYLSTLTDYFVSVRTHPVPCKIKA